MLKSYLKTAWRNIVRNKLFSFINIMGLAISIAAVLLILQYVVFELSYDKFHTNSDRIYRVQQDRYNNGKLSTQWAAGAYAVGNSFKAHFPEVEEYVKLIKCQPAVIEYGENSYKVKKAYLSSPAFFSVFTYPLLMGNAKTALTEPFTVVLSESIARKLFGKENPLGKTIHQDKYMAVKVTGVYKATPANTHLKADMLISYATIVNGSKINPETAWQWDGCMTYLLLYPGTDPKMLESKFPAVVNKLAGEDRKKFNSSAVYLLQPLRDIHLYSHLMWEAEPNGNGTIVYLLLGVALFIVVIAWINYINLATAIAMNRSVEVGVRKTVGSSKAQLIVQFLAESVLLNGLAVVLALLIVIFVMPTFNNILGQEFSFLAFIGSTGFWTVLLLLFLSGSFLSGLYPAFVLSGMKPVKALKGKGISSRQGISLRKSLVVFQFAVSQFLLVGTLTVFHQVQFMRSQQLGINIDQTLVVAPPIIKTDSTFMRQMAAFKEVLLHESTIRKVTASTIVPGQPSEWNAEGIRLKGADPGEGKQYRVIGIDYDFMDAYELKLLTGRNFSKDFGTDPKTVILNKTAVRQLGIEDPEKAVGKDIDFWGGTYKIIGVVDNFHMRSLHEAYEPFILRLIPDVRGHFSIRIAGNDINKTVATIQDSWNAFFPGNPFEYFFLDQYFNDQYLADQRFGKIFGLFTFLAILVACLGMFGLSSFTIIQRTKEIGIRKVMGATVSDIVQLLYKDFGRLVLISFLIAAPLAGYAALQWLNSYAFHTRLYWWMLLLPLVAILLVSFTTVSFQSIKAAQRDPTSSLRSE